MLRGVQRKMFSRIGLDKLQNKIDCSSVLKDEKVYRGHPWLLWTPSLQQTWCPLAVWFAVMWKSCSVRHQQMVTFKYLGHILNNKLTDDDDIKREIRCMFVRTNILLRRFGKCSVAVKMSLFRSYCLCFYDIGMWTKYSSTVFKRMEACYNKCIKSFFKYRRFYFHFLQLDCENCLCWLCVYVLLLPYITVVFFMSLIG